MLRPAANAVHSKLFAGRVVDRPLHGVRNGVPHGSRGIASSKLEVREIVDRSLGFRTDVHGVYRLSGLPDAVPSEV